VVISELPCIIPLKSCSCLMLRHFSNFLQTVIFQILGTVSINIWRTYLSSHFVHIRSCKITWSLVAVQRGNETFPRRLNFEICFWKFYVCYSCCLCADWCLLCFPFFSPLFLFYPVSNLYILLGKKNTRVNINIFPQGCSFLLVHNSASTSKQQSCY